MVTMARPIVGNETEAFGSDPSSDKSYRFRYKVVELDDLITSHKTDLTLNPLYPKELQPRIRDRAASRVQIEGMAQHLNPRVLLHDSGFIDTGPMIVGPDNVVESGNGRTLALAVAAKEAPENYARYKTMLETLADKYGFSKAHVSSMAQPVLVRERLGDINRVKFAQEANVGAVMGMSPYEQALQDSKKLSAELVGQLEVGEEQTIDQALRARSNDFIVQHFVSNVPANERAVIADDKGQINSQGLQRLRLALFAKTYTGSAGEKLTRIFGESADPYVKQLETAMFTTLPEMAKAEGLVSSGARDKELNVAPDIAEVVDTYASLKAQGLSVQDYLKQGAMFEERLTPFQKQLLEHLDDIGRKPKALREFFRETADKIIASPPPGQGSLLGDARLSKEEVLNGIINRQREEIGKPRVAVAPALSHRKEMAQADSPRTPGPVGLGTEVGSHVAKAPPTVPAGQPTLAPGASVQVGLAGIGPTHAQVKMLEEFGTAPGAGGQKLQLIDEEELKAKEEAKPLKGQMGFGGEVVGEEGTSPHPKPSPEEEPSPRKVAYGTAANYIRTIRNDDKRHYASKYWNWVADGKPGDEPPRGKISMMAAQAVRLKIDEIGKGLGAQPQEQAHEGQIGATRISKETWDKMVATAAETLEQKGPEFQVDDIVIWHSPHSGEDVEMNYRGRMGDKAMLYNPKGGWQGQVPLAQISRMKPTMDVMVAEARRWQGAAFEADSLYDKAATKERLAHSRMTTKADLDAYLMRKFGVSATEARDVSNELTHKNLKPDTSAAFMDYKDEPWAKAALAYDEASIAAPPTPEEEKPIERQQPISEEHFQSDAKDKEGLATDYYNYLIRRSKVIGKSTNVNVLRDMIASTLTRHGMCRGYDRARKWATDWIADKYDVTCSTLKQKEIIRTEPPLSKAAEKYDWRDRKITCQICNKEITTSHPMQTLEAQTVAHLRKEHGMTKDAAKMGYHHFQRDQGKVSTAPPVLHGSLAPALSTGRTKDVFREANDKALRYIRAIKNSEKQYYAQKYWSYLSDLYAGHYGMPEPDFKRSGLSVMAAQAVRDRLQEIGKDVPRKSATIYRGPPEVTSHGQSFEHAQVYATVVKLTDKPEEISQNYEKAQVFEQQRPPLSRARDEAQDHDRMIPRKEVTSQRLRSWKARPGGSDIRGVDSGRGVTIGSRPTPKKVRGPVIHTRNKKTKPRLSR